jgi:large-conductance mechanosensitive channel
MITTFSQHFAPLFLKVDKVYFNKLDIYMSNLGNPRAFKAQLKKFILDNGIIGAVAGVSIALVTKDIIQSLVGDIIIPLFFFIIMSLNIKSVGKILPGKTEIDFTNFIKMFITWIITIIITFLFIQIAFKQLLGVEDVGKEANEDKESFYVNR